MPVRNEDWIIGFSLRAALMWCDHIVALNHASIDRSAAILEKVKAETGRVTIIEEPDAKWDEMNHRQRLLSAGRKAGGTHFAIVDADEVITGHMVPSMRHMAGKLDRGWILQMPGYNLRGGMRYHADGVWGRRWFSVAFADHPLLTWAGDRFHAREPQGVELAIIRKPPAHDFGGVMHFWGVSERRLRAKHRLYKITERLRWPDKPVAEIDRLYSLAVHGSPRDPAVGWTYTDVPERWWDGYEDIIGHLDIDAAPWQEAECERLIDKYGRKRFAGLDLFEEKKPCKRAS